MLWDQGFEQFGFIRLVEVASAGRAFSLPRAEFSLDIHWKKLFDDDALLNGGLELVVDDVQLIEGALHEMVCEISPDVDGVFKTQFVEHPGPFRPTMLSVTWRPRPSHCRRNSEALRTMLPLKPPQRPRSLVTTTTSIFRP